MRLHSGGEAAAATEFVDKFLVGMRLIERTLQRRIFGPRDAVYLDGSISSNEGESHAARCNDGATQKPTCNKR